MVYGLLLGMLAKAAWDDLRTLRISNGLVLAVAGLWFAWRVLRVVVALAAGDAGGDVDAMALIERVGERANGLSSAVAPVSILVGLTILSILGFPAITAVEGIAGALVVGGGLLLATIAYETMTGRRAMGGGDIKLLASTALFLGVDGGLLCLLTACLLSLPLALILPRMGWSPADPDSRGAVDDPQNPASLARIDGGSRNSGSSPHEPGAPRGPKGSSRIADDPRDPADSARIVISPRDPGVPAKEDVADVSRETYPEEMLVGGRAPSGGPHPLGAVPFGPGIALGTLLALLAQAIA